MVCSEPGFDLAIGNDLSASLFGNGDKGFLVRLDVDVGEMDIIEFHSPDLLQLLLDPSAHFQCIFETAFDGIAVIVAAGVE